MPTTEELRHEENERVQHEETRRLRNKRVQDEETRKLRDKYASQALLGILSGAGKALPEVKIAATWAYDYADALIAARHFRNPDLT